jgi:hypothetical protein
MPSHKSSTRRSRSATGMFSKSLMVIDLIRTNLPFWVLKIHPEYQARSYIRYGHHAEITIRLSTDQSIIQPKQEPCFVPIIFVRINQQCFPLLMKPNGAHEPRQFAVVNYGV